MTTSHSQGLVDAHYERIVRLAQVMSGNSQDAHDLAQDTFLVAIKGQSAFRGESEVSTWLIGILRRLFLKQLRRRRPLMLSEAAEMQAPDDAEPVAVPTSDLATLVAGLPEHLRLVLVMFHYENMDYAAIATALSCPIGTVRSRLHEARARLRRHLVTKPAEREATP
jgi:RNA polymerase sigma-70 factor (ECF subfamily)